VLGSDRFVIERRIGEGSMGAVYLAFDRELQLRVALKTLRRVDPAGIYRFKREFRALSEMSHPNLVQLHELFSAGDQWYFTMEYVVGKSFLDHCLGSTLRAWAPSPAPTPGSDAKVDEHGELMFDTGEARVDGMEILFPSPLADPDKLREVLIQVTEGLMAVHAAGKLHRDLKSDNVMVTRDGRAVLLDFGIAIERAATDIHQTLEPNVLGTPAYMSPEQAAGHDIAPSSDFYALGVMIYEALTGNLPFDGSYTDVIQRKQRIDPPPPSQIVSETPEDLEQLCMRLLSREPSARPKGTAVLRALKLKRGVSQPPQRDTHPGDGDLRPFVGREGQLQALSDALSATDQGRPAVVLIEGPSGIGKTMLVDRYIERIRESRKAVILKGRCYERESVPFKAIDSLVDTLSRYLRRLPAVQSAELMPRDVMALAHLFPVLKRVPVVEHARRRTALPGDGKVLRQRAFAALKELLSRIADRNPMVVFVDDLQWGDVDSARLLSDLVTGSEAPALLLVGAYRSGEAHASPCLRALLSDIQPGGTYDLRTLQLDRLSSPDAIALAEVLLQGDGSVDPKSIGDIAGGNPYLVTELVDYVRLRANDGEPLDLDKALTVRLEKLSDDALTLLQLIAVAGRPVSEEVLSLAATFDINLQSALSELRARKLIRGVGSRESRAVEAYHDHIRQSVLSAMQPDLMQTWNRRLATTLEATGSVDLEALTEHLLGAGEFSRAGIYAVRAAAQAAQVLAFDKAARLYELAVKHCADAGWERQEVFARWAEALVNAGRSAEAAHVYFEAARGASEGEARDLRRKAGVQLLTSGHYSHSLEIVVESLGAVGVTLPASDQAAAEQLLELRTTLASRGLAFTLRREHEVPAEVLQRIDVVWSVTLGLLLNDLRRALPLTCQVLLDALEAGEPNRIMKALCLYHAFVDLALIDLRREPPVGALTIAEQQGQLLDTPEMKAWLTLARGVEAHYAGKTTHTVRLLGLAGQLFTDHCHGAVNEVRICRQVAAAAQVVFADVDQLETIAQWTREAEGRQDLMEAARLRAFSIFAAMRDDNIVRADELCQVVNEGWNSRSVNSLTDWIVLGAAYLYKCDSAGALQHAGRIEEVLESPLSVVRFWRSTVLWMRARLLLCASHGSSNPASLWREVDADIARIRRDEIPPLVTSATILEAQLARLRGMDDRALELIGTLTRSEYPHAQTVAMLLQGKWLGTAQGEEQSERARSAWTAQGVSNPDRWSNIFAPKTSES